MPKTKVILRIVYIHGFRGDHTTFQSFPTDLHNALLLQLPSHVELQSILYPTYKSRRAIGVATDKILEWLANLPPGPVILCGHSMGGLLAAEAATSSHTASKRVIALLAFDVPFLGMHPHVVISGIASLLPNKKGDSDKLQGGDLKSERELNDAQHVQISADGRSNPPSPNESGVSLPSPTMGVSNSLPGPSLSAPSLPPRPSSNHEIHTSPREPHSPTVLARAFDFLHSHADDPLVHFITKHRSEPLSAAKRWITESFEFGVCMFDPQGLRERYATLEKWNGPWVAFWTESTPRDNGEHYPRSNAQRQTIKTMKGDPQERPRNEQEETASLGKLLGHEPSLISPDSPSFSSSRSGSPVSTHEATTLLPPHGPPIKPGQNASEDQAKTASKQRDKQLKASEKATRKQQERELKALRKQHNPHSPHHFVVRPFCEPSSPIHRWELVKILGATHEVEAHCGLFLKHLNWEYEAFVQRVAVVVIGWTDGLQMR